MPGILEGLRQLAKDAKGEELKMYDTMYDNAKVYLEKIKCEDYDNVKTQKELVEVIERHLGDEDDKRPKLKNKIYTLCFDENFNFVPTLYLKPVVKLLISKKKNLDKSILNICNSFKNSAIWNESDYCFRTYLRKDMKFSYKVDFNITNIQNNKVYYYCDN